MAIDKDLDFTGKTILVTGSGRNIGRAIVLEFAARGANVIINARTNEEEARSVEKEAQALGAKTLVVMGTAGELATVEELQRRAPPAQDLLRNLQRGLALLPEPAADRVLVSRQGIHAEDDRSALGTHHPHQRPGRLHRWLDARPPLHRER